MPKFNGFEVVHPKDVPDQAKLFTSTWAGAVGNDRLSTNPEKVWFYEKILRGCGNLVFVNILFRGEKSIFIKNIPIPRNKYAILFIFISGIRSTYSRNKYKYNLRGIEIK